MKKLITLVFLFQIGIGIAQNVAFTDEVTSSNGLIYLDNNPFSGILFSSQDNVSNECTCTLKALYSNGKINGLKEEWYDSGQKKFKGGYIQGEKNGAHIFWVSSGNKEREEVYVKGKIIESEQYFPSGNLYIQNKFSSTNFNEKVYSKVMHENNEVQEEIHFKNGQLLERKRYYTNGNLKSQIKKDPKKLSETIYEKLLFEDGVIQTESYYKNNVLDGNFTENFANGKTHKKIKFHKGIVIEKTIYNEDGYLKNSLLQKPGSKYVEQILYFENEKIKERGYYSKNSQKDSVWTTFDELGNKLIQKSYILGDLIQEGKYKNNKKDGVWKYYMKDGVTQKNITFQSGNEVEILSFNVNHLFSNNYNSSDDVALLEFAKISRVKENIAFTSDTPFTKDNTNKRILGTILLKFLERMKMLNTSEINDNTVISKKIHITNMNVNYTASDVLGHITKEYFTTYEAYISFNLIIADADGKKIFSKSYKFNKSGKLLNSLLNAAVQTYATTKDKAFISALKSIKFKKLLKKYFPIDKKSKR